MAPWEDFNEIFSFNKKYHYDSKVVEQISTNRRALENHLFVDRLLGLTGIKGGWNNFIVLRASFADSNHLYSNKSVST